MANESRQSLAALSNGGVRFWPEADPNIREKLTTLMAAFRSKAEVSTVILKTAANGQKQKSDFLAGSIQLLYVLVQFLQKCIGTT